MATRQPTKAQLSRENARLRKQIEELQSAQPPMPRDEAELALRERIKELSCLYTISRLQQQHFPFIDRYLQGIVDCLPGSFQFPEQACARIRWGANDYLSASFEEHPLRIASEIRAGDKAGGVEVFYRKVPAFCQDGPFLPEEYTLIDGVADQIASVLKRMRAETDLRQAHEVLQVERRALKETNTALRTVLSRLEQEKREIRASVLGNIQKIVMPIVFELELQITGAERSYVTLLRQNLNQIAEPFLTELCRNHIELTPLEIVMATMIRNGLSTKDIARLRCISPATVRRHRENIRRKLGLTNRKVNLVTFLQSEQITPTAEMPAPVMPSTDDAPPV